MHSHLKSLTSGTVGKTFESLLPTEQLSYSFEQKPDRGTGKISVPKRKNRWHWACTGHKKSPEKGPHGSFRALILFNYYWLRG